MRISTNQIFQMSLTAMLNKQSQVSETQLQLATGKRQLVPSDDPSATSRVMQLEEGLAALDQYNRNADFAEARLKLSETTLTQAVDIVQRTRELAIYANNDTLTAADRDTIAVEVEQLRQAMLQIANTRDNNGEYIYSGFNTGTAAILDDGAGNYTYQGDQGDRLLQVGSDRRVSIGDPGDELVMRIDDGAGGITSIFEVFDDFMTDLRADAPQGVTITQLDSALQTFSDTRASLGARMNSIEQQRSANVSVELLMQENLSELEDLDYTEAVSRFEQQLLALQAAQQSFSRVQGLSLFNYLR